MRLRSASRCALAPRRGGLASRPLSDVHDASIRTVCLVADGRIDVGKFETWLEELLWEHGGPSGAHEGDEGEAGGGHRLEV